jgi:hypothetical protein
MERRREKMEMKVVKVIEGSFGVVMYEEMMMKVEGNSFEEKVDSVFRELMKDVDEKYFDDELYGVDGIIENVGILYVGEGIEYFVLGEGNEWNEKDCCNEEFYEYSCGLVGKLWGG